MRHTCSKKKKEEEEDDEEEETPFKYSLTAYGNPFYYYYFIC